MNSQPPTNRLKSQAFHETYRADWQELEALVRRTRRRGLRGLNAEQIISLPRLYRRTAASLAVARSISLDRALIEYLENLCLRGFTLVYGPREKLRHQLWRFFAQDWPAAVRSLGWMLPLSALLLFGGAFLGATLYFQDHYWFYSFMPDGMSGGRDPNASTAFLRDSLHGGGRGGLSAFATFLFVHNSLIGLLAFVLGVALGLPSMVLTLYNGLLLGVFTALYVEHGLGIELGGWLLVHGVTELSAIVLCGAAGLKLGWRMAFPGRQSRPAVLARTGPVMARVMAGCLLMFAVAGIMEGFMRQLVDDTATRYVLAALTGVFWLGYFAFTGRRGMPTPTPVPADRHGARLE